MQEAWNTVVRTRDQFECVLEPGQLVFDEGDPGDQLYIIQSGKIELSRAEAGGQRVLMRLGAGDFFGELGVVLGQPCNARAVAVSQTRLLGLDRETLERMCVDQPEIAIRMIRVLASRLIVCERRLAALGVDDLLRPMVRVLVRRAGTTGSAEGDAGPGILIDTTLRDLAAETGLSLLEAHGVIHQLFERKVLDLVDDRLIVADLEALSASLDT